MKQRQLVMLPAKPSGSLHNDIITKQYDIVITTKNLLVTDRASGAAIQAQINTAQICLRAEMPPNHAKALQSRKGSAHWEALQHIVGVAADDQGHHMNFTSDLLPWLLPVLW
jgi:hypothetical protein